MIFEELESPMLHAYAPFCSVVTDTYQLINNNDSSFLTPVLGGYCMP